MDENTNNINFNEYLGNENEVSPENDDVSPMNNTVTPTGPVSTLEKSTGPEVLTSEESEEATLFVGDGIHIETQLRGSIDGIIYYIDESLLRIMPEGTSDRIIDVPLAENSPDDVGIIDITYKKGPRTSFVELQGLRSGLTIQTFDKNGTPLAEYTVVSVKSATDSVIISDSTGAEQTLEFNYTGIPLNAGFDVLLVKSFEPEEEAVQNVINNNNGSVIENITEESDETEDESRERGFIAEFAVSDIPEIKKISQLSSSQIIYPEIMQKNDFLSNLISIMDPVQQNNQHILRRLRSIVELSSIMKNQLIKRNYNGTIEGENIISASKLGDILGKKNIPLSIPVVDVERLVLVSPEENTENDTIMEEEGISVDNFEDNLRSFIKDLSPENYNSLQAGTNPKFYEEQNRLIENYPSGWVFNSNSLDPYSFKEDGEFFRAIPGDELYGLSQNSSFTKDFIKNDITLSHGRALGPTYRKGAYGEKIESIPGAKTNIKGHILFPMQTSVTLGAIRTGNLFVDIARSKGMKSSIEQIIKSYEGVTMPDDEDTSVKIKDILYFKKDDVRLNQIDFNDFLHMILKTMIPRGIGDLTAFQADYGISDFEYTQEQMNIINERILEVIGSIRSRITTLRTQPAPVVSTIENSSPHHQYIINTIKEYTGLNDLVNEFNNITPNYKNSTLALTGYLLAKAQDYFYAVLSGSDNKAELEHNRYRLDGIIKRIHNEFKLTKLDTEKGVAPTENPCIHVSELELIRKTKDDNDRSVLFYKFMQKYQGKNDEHWINCIKCKQHLVCEHEYLQLQQYLHPREMDSIQKNIILTYGGMGAFNGNYICTNCGVSIRKQGLDTNIEFDDNGSPMIGRSVIEEYEFMDEDTKLEEYLNFKDTKEHTGITLKNNAKQEIYDIAREILGRIGISFSKESYMTVINKSNSYLVNLEDKNSYEIKKKAQKTSSSETYDIYVNKNKVIVIASQIIIEIQTHIPDYLPLYTETGCEAGFDGFPLISNDSPKMDNVGHMIPYMVCCLEGLIYQDKAPWKYTGWRSLKDKEKREVMNTDIIRSLKRMAETDLVKRKIETKLEYIEKVFGRKTIGERPSEVVPAHFYPLMMFKDESSQINAENPTYEIVTKNKVNTKRVGITWINTANEEARKTVDKIVTPRAETGSCFGSISSPLEYFKTHADIFPGLPSRTITVQPFKARSIIGVPYETRPGESIESIPDQKVMWRLFLQLCYKGEREGQRHEMGYDHKCIWCGIEIPTEFLYPDVGSNGTPIIDDSVVIQSFAQQGISITPETFMALTVKANSQTMFDFYKPVLNQPYDLFNSLSNLEPAPVQPRTEDELSWQDLYNNMKSLIGDENDNPIVFLTKITEFSTSMDKLKKNLIMHYTDYQPTVFDGYGTNSLIDAFTNLLVGEPHKILENIRSYYLLPIQRLINEYTAPITIMAHKKDVLLLKDNKAEETIILKINENRKWRTRNNITINTLIINKERLKTYTSKLSAYLKNSTEFSVRRIPHREVLFGEIVKGFFYGPLLSLVEETTDLDQRAEILKMFKYLTRVYEMQNKVYTQAQLREEKAVLSEKEKASVIDIFDRLTDEQKRAELTIKRMGGKSSISGKDWFKDRLVGKLSTDIKWIGAAVGSEFEQLSADGIQFNREDVYADTESGYDYENPYADD